MRFTAADGVSLHFTDEGPRDGKVVLCLSGLTRNGTDFDYVAPHLGDVRLIRMDYRGRGRSDWAEPATYTVPVEAGDALALLDHLGIARAAVLGTSRGGLIAMVLAATAKGRLTGVCLNDIGPVIEAEGLAAIRDFIGQPPGFRTYEEAAVARSRFMAGFDGVPMERWRAEAAKHYVEGPEGLAINYDPRLRDAFLAAFEAPAPDLWPVFDALAGLPLALIRGENSDLLSAATAAEMRRRRPDMLYAEVPDRGHVPFLDEPEALAVIRAWVGETGMNIAMIEAAAERIRGHARVTPLLSSPFLDEIAGRRVLVKPECLQHTGSFKYRGARAAVSALAPEVRARGVIAFSSGNHAQGVALAAREYGVPSVIIMPVDAPRMKIDNTRALGAEVVLYDRAGGEDRDAIGARLSAERGLTLIKPFDEPEVIAGQGTVGLEIAAQAAEFGVTEADVLVCCGGGGLTSGIAMALEARAPGLRARPVEPEGFDDTARSLAAGHVVRNARPSGSICDAIVTPEPGKITFPIMQRLCGPGIAVPDEDCLRAMAAAFQRLKIVAEPGGAVALAAALWHGESLRGDAVIAVVSGGNVDADMFCGALARYA